MKADAHREDSFSIDVRREYDRATIVGNAFAPTNAYAEEKGDFVRIGRRFYARPETFIEELSKGDTSYSSTISGVGRSIAIGEEKYFISKLSTAVKTITVETKKEMLDSIGSSRLQFSAVFMPIDYYADFHIPLDSQSLNGTIHYEDQRRFLVIGPHRIPPFWSSKYVEFDRFYFITANSLEWLVKTDGKTGHRVRISIVPNDDKGKFDVTCETIACMRIRDPEAAISFKLEQPPADRE